MKKIIKLVIVFWGVLFLCFGILCICISKYENRKEQIIQNAKVNELDVTFFDKKNFCVTEGTIKYYYELKSPGVVFSKCEIVTEEQGIKVKEGNVIVSIEENDSKQESIRVSINDSRVILSDDGKEKRCFSHMFFISNDHFEESSLQENGAIDGKQKAIDAYYCVMKFLTAKELKEYYNRSLAICDLLNGRR